MSALPTGTVTFLFTDIEGSTRLWEQHPEAMSEASARHDALLNEGIQQLGGIVVKSRGEGDSLFAVFARASDAVAAACAILQALLAEAWATPSPLRVRVGVHTGEAELREGDYYGAAVNRCARLRAVAHGGQALLSLATADRVREQLPEGVSLRDLGSHRLKDLQQPEQLFQLLHPALPADFPPLRSLALFAHNLPVQLTRFIGREQAMAQVKRLLAESHLLTLTGSGGCGKTRLALQVAADLVEEYADGVWLVELAALADPALVPQTVATALGVREQPERSLTELLIDYLRLKHLLLVVDNCEHLLATCASLAESLLRSCPKLRILASSREGLGVAGEQTYRVPSLSTPPLSPSAPKRGRDPSDAQALLSPERLQEFEAVQLFAARAALSQPSFAVTAANAAAVVEVCRRLDGIPLAIELAAARVKALPVERINERLSDMFRLLTGGSRTALPRQQTLRALIDWSYDLLCEAERALLRRLSAFAGGWTLEAAEAVCIGGGVEEWEVLDLLTSLVEKSLVLYEERGGEGRYRLLETVRQYARDRLLEAGEAEAVRTRHRDWFLALAEQAEEGVPGESQTEWLDLLEAEHDNLRAALAWSAAHGQIEAGLRLGGAMRPFWDVRGYYREGWEHLTGLLAMPGAESRTAVRAKALLGAGWLASLQGDSGTGRALAEESLALSRELDHKQGIADSLRYLGWILGDSGAARELWEESLSIYRELGHKEGIARSIQGLGATVHDQGEYEAARALFEESLAIFREIKDEGGVAGALDGLAWAAYALGEHERARALFEESLASYRALGHKEGIAWALKCLGHLAFHQGNYGAAWARLEESLAIGRELGNRRVITWSIIELGHTLRETRDYRAARALFEESLAIFRELADEPGMVRALEGLAMVAAAQAQPERATRLFGAAEGLREAIGAPLPPADRAEHDRSVAAALAALGEEAFAAAWAEGRGMTLDHAIMCALESTDS